MEHDVLEARYVRDHVLWLLFRDGTAGEVDLGPELNGEVFEPLLDLDYFKRFTIHPQCRTLVWPNDADLAPEFLHEAARRQPAPPPLARNADPPRALDFVREWAALHRAELLENWSRARRQQPLEPIAPLE